MAYKAYAMNDQYLGSVRTARGLKRLANKARRDGETGLSLHGTIRELTVSGEAHLDEVDWLVKKIKAAEDSDKVDPDTLFAMIDDAVTGEVHDYRVFSTLHKEKKASQIQCGDLILVRERKYNGRIMYKGLRFYGGKVITEWQTTTQPPHLALARFEEVS